MARSGDASASEGKRDADEDLFERRWSGYWNILYSWKKK